MQGKFIIIIQARMSSTRLPGKVLMSVNDAHTLLSLLITRLKICVNIDDIIVATTCLKVDDCIESVAQLHSISCFRGSENDVLDRYYQCSLRFPSDYIVRITADDPLKDPKIIDGAIGICVDNPIYDYVSNTLNPTYPEGMDVEIVKSSILHYAAKNAILESEREHVLPYIWNRPEKFRLYNFTNDEDLSQYRLTVDHPSDLTLIRNICEHFICKPTVDFKEIISYLLQNPTLVALNASIKRNEGYIKSIEDEVNE